uniref:Distal membrane-arm assembly complex protein 1-like domain-containing protein n=1 Tax=Chrysemys picta bellii TaxID=8478 RepID=A0A8C3P956_CHRPI
MGSNSSGGNGSCPRRGDCFHQGMPKGGLAQRPCWGCRILSGSVLIGAGFWVYLGSRRVISRGIASSVGNIVQLVFAASEYLLCCGVIILADPFGKLKK